MSGCKRVAAPRAAHATRCISQSRMQRASRILACSSIHARCMLQLADAHAATVAAVLRKKRPATVPTIATHGACSKVHDALRCTTVASARAAMSACRVGVQNNLRRHCGGTCHPYLWMLSAALISPSRAERTRTESFPATVPLQAATQPECATHAACGCVRCAVYVRSCCMLHQCQVCIGRLPVYGRYCA